MDRVARELAPDVLRIKMLRTRDHFDHPMLEFLVLLADESSTPDKLHALAQRAEEKVTEELRLDDLEDHYSIFRFRRKTEQDAVREKVWE